MSVTGKPSRTVAQDDDSDLSRFGYAQELFRNMGGFSNFAISFSIISILTGAVTLYGYGLEMGGPLEMTLGWPIATFFMLLVAASMGELCSAYPTSGAMYHWAVALGSPAIGWFVAWFNILGLIAAQAAINYSCAQFILPFLGIPASAANLFLMFAFITFNQGLLNHFGVRLVAILNDLSVTVHIIGVFIIVGAIFWMAPLQPASYLATAVNSNGRSPYWWAFLLGLLQAHWTFTGFDASAHMAEETRDPRRRAPWGIVLSVAVSGFAGYLLLISLTLAAGDLHGVLGARDADGNTIPAAIAVLQQALSPRFGAAMGALASMAMWFCGLSCIASASRALFSLARDNGTPLSGLLRRVHPKHGTPGPAIWAIVAASIAAMVWTGAIPVVTSLSTVALYVAYVIPLMLGLRARRRINPWTSRAVWNLGAAGPMVNAIAILYTVFICVVLVMPPNLLAGQTFAGLVLALAALWFFKARSHYAGPDWIGKEIDQ
ncbi:MAG: amino acid permease [Acidobacteriia bacterium]|nr:amino acid permease [Terriglobia bacterium]